MLTNDDAIPSFAALPSCGHYAKPPLRLSGEFRARPGHDMT
jgi:hypothetical protein